MLIEEIFCANNNDFLAGINFNVCN